MFTTTIQPVTGPSVGFNALSRLMTAAVVNQSFRQLLLTNPLMAMSDGYLGENFSLASDEKELVLSIQASDLTDFANQLINNRNGNGHKNAAPGLIEHGTCTINQGYRPATYST
jgi:hypothetical protein